MLNHLFRPLQVGRMVLKNRIVLAPMHTNLVGDHGEVTDALIRYYGQRATGGAGLVGVEITHVDGDRSSKRTKGELGADSDACIDGLARLAAAIHEAGTKAMLQLFHAGARRAELPAAAPSPCWWGTPPAAGGEATLPDELTVTEISEIVRAFARAAVRARTAGFDAVEIHGAHGYLIHNFLAPTHNLRTDGYGGTLEGRARLALEVVQAVRAAVGRDFPLSFRISGDWVHDGLIDADEPRQVARMLAAAGIDLLHVTGSRAGDPTLPIVPSYAPAAPFRERARGIREATGLPVLVTGSIHSPELAAAVLAAGDADLVGAARQFLADPDWPRKAMEGRMAEITPCIRCNSCRKMMELHLPTRCAVNPCSGREEEFVVSPAGRAQRVLVIGGGPAGLEAARVAAARGHRVTLWERREAPGGRLRLAAQLPFKRDWQRYLDHQLRRVKDAGVEVICGRTATATAVAGHHPDAVVLACGSAGAGMPDPGKNGPRVLGLDDLLLAPELPNGHVLVYGDGAPPAEAAWWLALQGRKVTLVCPDSRLGTETDPGHRHALAMALAGHGVEVLLESNVTGLTAGGAVIEGAAGRRIVDAGTVVWAAPPEGGQVHPLKEELERAFRVLTVGDAAGLHGVLFAVHGGAAAALEI